MKAPFKWAGGKRRIAEQVISALGPIKGRYVEPFCGSGAVFFALQEAGEISSALLNDSSLPVTTTLAALNRYSRAVMEALQVLREKQLTIGHVECYEHIKAFVSHPHSLSPAIYAAYFLAANAVGFNGLWRVNKAGTYNVPIGKRGDGTYHDIPTRDLTGHGEALAFANITCADFRALDGIGDGDVVYCDPPYLGKFSGYGADVFSPKDHRDLLEWAEGIKTRGGRVVISGSDTEATREIYGEPTYVVGIANTIGVGNRASTRELIYVV